mgnify:CR=1 FL=1
MRTDIVHLDDLPPGATADAVVVIDVCRAFTVAPWCYGVGAASVLLASCVADALAARAYGVVLVKDGVPDPRFDLPNAPGLIARTELSGRRVVQLTGNGTRGVHAVTAPHVLCASFVTAGATARVLAGLGAASVLFVPTEGDEDLALAEYLVAVLGGASDAAGYLQRAAHSAAADELRARGPDPAYPGVDPDDLTRCLELDRFDFALEAVPDGATRRLVRRRRRPSGR